MGIDKALRLLVEDSVEEDFDEGSMVVLFARTVQLFDDVLEDLRLAIVPTVDTFKECFCPHDAMD